eukprot:g1881.t1
MSAATQKQMLDLINKVAEANEKIGTITRKKDEEIQDQREKQSEIIFQMKNDHAKKIQKQVQAMESAFAEAEKELRIALNAAAERNRKVQDNYEQLLSKHGRLTKQAEVSEAGRLEARKLVDELSGIVREQKEKLNRRTQRDEEALRRQRGILASQWKVEERLLKEKVVGLEKTIAEMKQNFSTLLEERSTSYEKEVNLLRSKLEEEMKMQTEKNARTYESEKQRLEALVKDKETALQVKVKMLESTADEVTELKTRLKNREEDLDNLESKYRNKIHKLEKELDNEIDKRERAEDSLVEQGYIVDDLQAIIDEQVDGGVMSSHSSSSARNSRERRSQRNGDGIQSDDHSRSSLLPEHYDNELEDLQKTMQEQLDLKNEALDLLEKEMGMMREKFADCQDALKERRDRVVELENELDEVSQKLGDVTDDKEELETELSRLRKTNDKLQNQLDDYESKVNSLREECEEYRTECGHLEEKIQRQKKEFKDLFLKMGDICD